MPPLQQHVHTVPRKIPEIVDFCDVVAIRYFRVREKIIKFPLFLSFGTNQRISFLSQPRVRTYRRILPLSLFVPNF